MIQNQIQGVRNALIDILCTLNRKRLDDCSILIKTWLVHQALKLQLFKVLFHKSEGQFNCIPLRRIRHVVDVLKLEGMHFCSDF